MLWAGTRYWDQMPDTESRYQILSTYTKYWEQLINIEKISHILGADIKHSPTLYSQITGKYTCVESKIFPHILLLCSISYSCFNGLTINQHFIKPLQGEKCTSYLSVVDYRSFCPVCSFSLRYVGAPIYGYAHVHERQQNCCDRRFSGCLQ